MRFLFCHRTRLFTFVHHFVPGSLNLLTLHSMLKQVRHDIFQHFRNCDTRFWEYEYVENQFSLLFNLLKIFELKGRLIHYRFNLLVSGVKGKNPLPDRDGLIQVAGSILFEAIFE